MAGPQSHTECANGSANTSILASEGVEFLLSAEGKVPLSSLEQKTIYLVFSANWCRPCRNFIPQLVQLYNTLRKTNVKLEIIFVSFDRDENGFREHFKCMPWLALPFDVSLRRRLCDRYHVDRIPSLIPLCMEGKLVEEDAVELIEDYGIDAFPFSKERREELKAMDNVKRQGGKLEDLLVLGERDFVVSGSGEKIPVSSLVGKAIGLYFGAHWCPPCRAFTAQLTEAYNELNTTQNKNLEIIFISTDRDQEEFDLNIRTMPWLAIPYGDRTRQDLCRIFDIKGIPALVLLGPDGKILNTNGRALISSYGAKAFPFTKTRIDEIEAALRKEGDALPKQVKDSKHEHILKLDMAKAYVCNSCKGQGRFWVFSCDKCDYDLHPTCVEEAH
ncbi:PREDICTED: probable nucleoredoxin 3 [Nelumbo nucifera]|uniref:protein-disulfide reductase n=1 Tax=Nelumbo nucifera TaxID=4432 RepID=A0A1U8ALX2_NELNU|nr:PREDICTED: probable nucleoredoxin 3 [Nelumbo nucifera]XP_010263378.1 PREDICTED: probable nucleoredoxin 3 [Nelumbo nucifera]XP_019054003.1 PREDICTED: probable nucleoredoxin 3 [Nelumbo nucifera]